MGHAIQIASVFGGRSGLRQQDERNLVELRTVLPIITTSGLGGF
ncbi:hypothetical protein ACWAT4_11795 [Bradyrhizobium manausense]